MYLVGRLSIGDYQSDKYAAEISGWLRAIGQQPEDVRHIAVVQQPTGSYELHLSMYTKDASGNYVVDYAANEITKTPVVIPITKGTWPGWITGLGNLSLPKEWVPDVGRSRSG